jgi:hypothetical protein
MDSITRAAHFALSTVLRDEPWQDLGFTKRPQYGAIVQRFRPLWRVRLEKTALKQMIEIFTAAHVHAGSLDEVDVPNVVEIILDGPNGTQELWRSYGYTSRTEAKDHFTRAIEDYVESESQGWASILGSALDVSSVPNEILAANLFVGVVRFAQTAEDMLPFLRPNAS